MSRHVSTIKKFILYLVVTIFTLLTLSSCIPHYTKDEIGEDTGEKDSNHIEIEVEHGDDIQHEGGLDNREEEQGREEEEEEEELKTITVSAVGDIMVHSPQFKSAYVGDGRYDFVPVFQEIKKYIANSDLALCNLETTISTPDREYSGYPNFKTPEELIPAIKDAGFDVVTTANNHSLDAKEFGVINTIDVLEKYDLIHTGTARDEEESKDILMVEREGIQLAVLAYTYGTNGMEAAVDQDKLKYMVNYIELDKIKEDINRARQEGADVIILCMHWGVEYARTVGEDQKNISDALFDAGADIILGSHPHVIQTMERKTVTDSSGEDRDVFVAYSLGNFISNQRDQYTDSGVIVNITITKQGQNITIGDVKYTPTWVRKFQQNGKLQYRILPVEEFIDSQLPTPELERIRAVWKETTNIIDDETVTTKKE